MEVINLVFLICGENYFLLEICTDVLALQKLRVLLAAFGYKGCVSNFFFTFQEVKSAVF